MNIFFLSLLAELCAKYHFNMHVNKMISETCQLLSTAWAVLNPTAHAALLEAGDAWKATHQNHPCAVWARTHTNNYRWLASLGLALCTEFELRFSGAPHSAKKQLLFLSANVPHIESSAPLWADSGITMPPQCMPEELRIKDDPVGAYRQYYQSEGKAKLRWWRLKSAAVVADDAEQFVPPWFVARPLARPKYFVALVEKAQIRATKRKREEPLTSNKQLSLQD